MTTYSVNKFYVQHMNAFHFAWMHCTAQMKWIVLFNSNCECCHFNLMAIYIGLASLNNFRSVSVWSWSIQLFFFLSLIQLLYVIQFYCIPKESSLWFDVFELRTHIKKRFEKYWATKISLEHVTNPVSSNLLCFMQSKKYNLNLVYIQISLVSFLLRTNGWTFFTLTMCASKNANVNRHLLEFNTLPCKLGSSLDVGFFVCLFSFPYNRILVRILIYWCYIRSQELNVNNDMVHRAKDSFNETESKVERNWCCRFTWHFHTFLGDIGFFLSRHGKLIWNIFNSIAFTLDSDNFPVIT